MIISPSRNFAFVHVHKTAGEALTLALIPHLGPGDLTLGSSRAGRLRDIRYGLQYGISKHSPARTLRDYVGAETWERWFTFAIVRHPFDRVRSLHSYLRLMSERRATPGLRNLVYRLPGLGRADPLAWPGLQALHESTDFSEFIRHPKFRADPGARPQCDMLVDDDGRLLVDFVGHFERLEADFAQITERLELGRVVMPHHNVSGDRAAKPALSAADRAELHKLYAVDFDAFGFDPELG